jgi:hypothetical protein
MYRAGCWLLCGFEAADERHPENIEKKASLDDNTAASRPPKARPCQGAMSCGHPGEARRHRQHPRLAIRSAVDEFDCDRHYRRPIRSGGAAPRRQCGSPPARTGDRLHAYEVDYSVCRLLQGRPQRRLNPSCSPIT